MRDEVPHGAYSERWLDVIAAVEYLGATRRPGLTVWEALAEAVRWWVEAEDAPAATSSLGCDVPWSDPDPLRTTLELLLRLAGPAGTLDGHDLPTILDGALGSWLNEISTAFNDGYGFARRD